MTLDYNETIRRRDGTLTPLQDFCKENGGDTTQIEQEISVLADDVSTNISAISSITSQLSALVDDVGTNTSAIGSITSALSKLNGKIGSFILSTSYQDIPEQDGKTMCIFAIGPTESSPHTPCWGCISLKNGNKVLEDPSDAWVGLSFTISNNKVRVKDSEVRGTFCYINI